MAFDPPIQNVTTSQLSTLAKGAIITSTGAANTTVSVGGNYSVLGADSAQSTGLTFLTVPVVLNTVTGVDMKSVGATTLYTVPAGKTLYLVDVLVEPTTVAGFAIAATLRIGKSAAYTEWLAATALTGLTAVSKFFSLSGSALGLVKSTFASGEVVAADVTVGATATTFTAKYIVIGYLI